MSIALFAIIGALLEAGAWYWIIFGLYSSLRCLKAIVTLFKAIND